MGRCRSPLHVIAFLLAIALAGPWNVALAAVEPSPTLLPTKQDCRVARGNHRLQRVSRSAKWRPTACSAVSPDFDDSEERDDSGVFHPWSLVTLPADLPGAVVPPGQRVATFVSRKTVPLQNLCRFRC